MGIFKNGKKIFMNGEKTVEDIQSLADKKENSFRERLLKSNDNECAYKDEYDYDEIIDKESVIMNFEVLHMSFLYDTEYESTCKVMILRDLKDKKRYYLEIDVYDFDESDIEDKDLIDIVNIIEGDSIEIEMEEFDGFLDIDNFIRVTII